jgi:hypothetical protein
MRIEHSPFLFHTERNSDDTTRLCKPVFGLIFLTMHDRGLKLGRNSECITNIPLSQSTPTSTCDVTHEVKFCSANKLDTYHTPPALGIHHGNLHSGEPDRHSGLLSICFFGSFRSATPTRNASYMRQHYSQRYRGRSTNMERARLRAIIEPT